MLLQELDFGDLVVTQDFKGAGLWTAVPDPDNAPFMKLRKNGRDSTGEKEGGAGRVAGWLAAETASTRQPFVDIWVCGQDAARQLGHRCNRKVDRMG